MMTKSHRDKGILQIDYNYLNLPKYIKFDNYVTRNGVDVYINTTYLYRADGVKLKKVYNYFAGRNMSNASQTVEYVDGFQYQTTSTGAGSIPNGLQFVPTSEGYYDFIKSRYIYSYKDHLGNIRLSYFRNTTTGSAEVLEENNYYAFGLKYDANFISSRNPSSYNYQYNGKELQMETGWNDYGWRQYMPEIGRWNGMDQLSENYYSDSPYAYVLNNPVMMFDPDGRVSNEWVMSFWNNSQSGYNTTWTNTGSSFTSNWGGSMDYNADPMNFYFGDTSTGIIPTMDIPGIDMKGTHNNWGQSFQNSFNSYMSNWNNTNWWSNTGAMAYTGTLTFPTGGGASAGTWASIRGVLGELAGLSRFGIWTLPLLLEGDTSRREQKITLYRGVSVDAKGSMYFYASQGIAIPRGFEQVSTNWGPHSDMEAHAGGDNFSIWTSWTTSKETARDFATGVAMHMNGIPGIIMSKQFNLTEVTPNVYNQAAEAEWLVPGVVYGAKVEYVSPRTK